MHAQCPMCKTLIDLTGETCVCPGCGRTLALPAGIRSQPAPPVARPAPPPERYDAPPPRPPLPFNNDGGPPIPIRRLTEDGYGRRHDDDDDYDEDDERPFRRRPRRRRRESAEYASARLLTNWLLFGIAGITMVCGAILFTLPNIQAIPPAQRTVIVVILVVQVFLFIGLGFWSMFQPLPPAIIGLVIYVVIAVMDIMVEPKILTNPFFWIRFLIVGGFIKAITSLANSR